MKSIAAASLLALSLFAGVVSADDAKSNPTSDETIMIYATSVEDAQRQIQSLDAGAGSSIIVFLKNPDGTTTELRGVNFAVDA